MFVTFHDLFTGFDSLFGLVKLLILSIAIFALSHRIVRLIVFRGLWLFAFCVLPVCAANAPARPVTPVEKGISELVFLSLLVGIIVGGIRIYKLLSRKK